MVPNIAIAKNPKIRQYVRLLRTPPGPDLVDKTAVKVQVPRLEASRDRPTIDLVPTISLLRSVRDYWRADIYRLKTLRPPKFEKSIIPKNLFKCREINEVKRLIKSRFRKHNKDNTYNDQCKYNTRVIKGIGEFTIIT